MEPQTQSGTPPSHVVKYIGVLIVGILIGLGSSFAFPRVAPTGIVIGGYQEGFDAAKKRVMESPMGMIFRTPDDIRSVSGTVTAISGNQITIHTESQNPFDDPALADRTVLITADTKITKITQKDPRVIQAEADAFMKRLQAGVKAGTVTPTPPQPLAPPEPFTRTPAMVADIVVNETITVITVGNIRTIKEFSASEIQIQSKVITS